MDNATAGRGVLRVSGHQWLTGQTSDKHGFIDVVRNIGAAMAAGRFCVVVATPNPKFVVTGNLTRELDYESEFGKIRVKTCFFALKIGPPWHRTPFL